MASAGLKDELICPICLNFLTYPAYLSCGHNFCRFCVVRVLDIQEVTGAYSCPECKAKYSKRPALKKNRKLLNIVEHFLSSQPDMEEPPQIFCAYCDASTPAVRTCLQCENSLCDKHLTVHNKTMDHILVGPTLSTGRMRCSLHNKLLEYYCPQDAACLCMSCCFREHWGHKIELLDEAFGKRKEKLRNYLNDLYPQRAKLQTRVQNLQDHMWTVHQKASEKKENISKLFMDIRKQLETAEAKALSEVFRQEEKAVFRIRHLIQKLEVEEQELSKKLNDVEEMCRVTDPITLLQESDNIGYEDDEDTWGDGDVRSGEDLDEVLISLTLHRSMRDIFTCVTSDLSVQVPDVLLDVATAYNYIKISEDLKMATDSEEQDRPQSSVRFKNYSHVLSRCGLSSGRHYWEVEWNKMGKCEVGMCYPSVEREGCNADVGVYAKSWYVLMSEEAYDVGCDSLVLRLCVKPQCPKLGVFLDYEAGRLSFYELRDHVTHLYTITASFTDPLHVNFYLEDGASVKIPS